MQGNKSQGDYQSSMTEDMYLDQDEKNVLQLTVRMFVIVKFHKKKKFETVCRKNQSLLRAYKG